MNAYSVSELTNNRRVWDLNLMVKVSFMFIVPIFKEMSTVIKSEWTILILLIWKLEPHWIKFKLTGDCTSIFQKK